MDVWVIVVVVVLLLIAGYLGTRSRRSSSASRDLGQRFGSGYDRVAERASDRGAAAQELERRVERHERLDVPGLSSEQRERSAEQWLDVQRRFVDDPEGTVGDADRLITQALRERGYPTEHDDQKVQDLSVEHADTLDAYREAHHIADRHARDGVSTDELRRAMQHYRTVFEDIVETRARRSEQA